MYYIYYLYLSMYNGVWQNFFIKWWSCRLTVTRLVPLVEQELLTFWSSTAPMGFGGVHVTQSLVLCIVFYRLLLVFFDHCIVCPYDYPLGIFKLFLWPWKWDQGKVTHDQYVDQIWRHMLYCKGEFYWSNHKIYTLSHHSHLKSSTHVWPLLTFILGETTTTWKEGYFSI